MACEYFPRSMRRLPSSKARGPAGVHPAAARAMERKRARRRPSERGGLQPQRPRTITGTQAFAPRLRCEAAAAGESRAPEGAIAAAEDRRAPPRLFWMVSIDGGGSI